MIGASRTALGAALYRAAHQLVDHPPVFEDPLALTIVGADAEARLRAGHDPRASSSAAPLRAYVAARSRFAEDGLTAAFGTGLRQYVLLGAGLDTFAYRNPFESLRVFEVDHPATQAWKREVLERTAIAAPRNVTYAPVDFERETMSEGLSREAFDFSRPAFFAWLGVTPYLEAAAVMRTLEDIAREMKPGSELVFDVATPRPPDQAATAAQGAFESRLSAIGEPLRSAFVPKSLARSLSELGMSRSVVVDPAALNARYFDGRTDGLAVRRGHILHAWVGPGAGG
jgi:methyltransferase (TIGR00027 family)